MQDTDHPYHRADVQSMIVNGQSRRAILNWLQWADPNGAHHDSARKREGAPRLTISQARDIMRDILAQNL